MNKEELFQGIYGLDEEKNEIYKYINWFMNKEKYESLGIEVPNALLLYGTTGCGKTQIIKNIIKYSKIPSFIVTLDDADVIANIKKVYNEASLKEKAIIVFDELDLLIDKDERVVKIIKDQIGGVFSKNNVFYIAATNLLESLPCPLLRKGRFGIQLKIGYPKKNDIKQYLIDKLSAFYGDKFQKDYLQDNVLEMFRNRIFSEIESFVNRLFLEYPTNSPDFEQFMELIARLVNDKLNIGEANFRVCIHEASHALIAYRFKKYLNLQYAYVGGNEGTVYSNEVDTYENTYESTLSQIATSYGGALGEKAFFGSASVGCHHDLDSARKESFILINRIGFQGLSKTIAASEDDTARQPSSTWLRRNERLITQLLKKIEKDTANFIRKNKEAINEVAKKFKDKKVLLGSEIEGIFESYHVNHDDKLINELIKKC